MSVPEPEDRFANVSAPTFAFTGMDTDPRTGSHGVIIRMSTSKQYVAELKGQRMWDAIYNALMQLCPLERGTIGCYGDNMPGALDPNQRNMVGQPGRLLNKFWIQDIPYRDDKGNYATNAFLRLTLQGIFREQNFPGLASATVRIHTPRLSAC